MVLSIEPVKYSLRCETVGSIVEIKETIVSTNAREHRLPLVVIFFSNKELVSVVA